MLDKTGKFFVFYICCFYATSVVYATVVSFS